MDDWAKPTTAKSLPQEVAARFTWRGWLLGLLGVIFICGFTPFNDYAVNNTYMVGNFLPIGLMAFFLVFILGINALLWKLTPAAAIKRRDLALAMLMTLVSCALPSSGLMRYLPANLVGVYHRAGEDSDAARVLDVVQLPQWMLPTMHGTTAAARAGDPVVQHYWGRTPLPPQQDHFWGHLRYGTPWAAWRTPAVTWAVFLCGLYGIYLFLNVIVYHQWARNERLPFPLASVYMSLIEQPAPGKAFNTLFRAKIFWLAVAAVFLMHGVNALHQYDAEKFPELPLGFNLGDVLKGPPWDWSEYGLRHQRIFFCFVGICFFLQTKISFSLWFLFILLNVVKMSLGTVKYDYDWGRRCDFNLGAAMVYAGTLVWVGREHWWLVLRQMFAQPRQYEPTGDFVSYRYAGWGLLACSGLALAWLLAAGVSLVGAVVLLLTMVTLLMLVARILAETGLIFITIVMPLLRPWVQLMQPGIPGIPPIHTTARSYFFTSWFNQIFAHDARESLPAFALTGLKLADEANDGNPRQRPRRSVFAAIVLSLVVGYTVAGASTLYVAYAYSNTLDTARNGPINGYGLRDTPKNALNNTNDFLPPRQGPHEVQNHAGFFALGAILSGTLAILRLRYVAWPLHPIGLLLCGSYAVQAGWFSIFLGWLAKALIVRFGGIHLYRLARFFFIGLIVGETSAAAFWLFISVLRLMLGMEYHAINLLPG